MSQPSGGMSTTSPAVHQTLVCELNYKSPALLVLSSKERIHMPSEELRGGASLPVSSLTSTSRAVIFLFLLIFSHLNNTLQWFAPLGSSGPYFPRQATDGFVFCKQGLGCFPFQHVFSKGAQGCFMTPGFSFASVARSDSSQQPACVMATPPPQPDREG